MKNDNILTKPQRLQFIRSRYSAEPDRPATAEEAQERLTRIMNEVEDLHSGAPYDPHGPGNGRMYPPDVKYIRPDEFDLPGVKIFHQVAHRTLFGFNGAVRIEVRKGPGAGDVLLDEPGQDGRRISDLRRKT